MTLLPACSCDGPNDGVDVNSSEESHDREPTESFEEIKKGKKRVLPEWVPSELPSWGSRVSLPEWDLDDDLEDGLDSDDKDENDENDDSARTSSDGPLSVPREWKTIGSSQSYRSQQGWKGSDLCHSQQSPVRISHYALRHDGQDGCGAGTTLTGLVHFTPRAESHAGYCHGGSMTSVMDDIIGWCAFHVTGTCRPWSGYTAQINTCLRRPIPIHTYCKARATVTKWEGRKVWVHSQLVSLIPKEPTEHGNDLTMTNQGTNHTWDEILHCSAEGLVILKKTQHLGS